MTFERLLLILNVDLKDKKATGRKADVILAAYNAAEAALRLLKPGSNVRGLENAAACVS